MTGTTAAQGAEPVPSEPVPSEPVLSVRGLAVDYSGSRGGTIRALDGVDLDVRRGEIVAVVGESGSGKTTMARAILGLLDTGQVAGGSILLSGTDITGLGERQLQRIRGRRIGLVPQDPTVSLDPVKRIGVQVADVARVHGLVQRRGAAALAVEMLERVGISEPRRVAARYPHELSGGMRQRVLIAMALVGGPELLIADEPTSALDVTVQRRILDLIVGLARQSDTTVVLITHDLAVAADRADRIVVMKDGAVIEHGPTARIIGDPASPYTRALLDAAPVFPVPRPSAPTGPTAGDPPTQALVEVRSLVRDFGRGPAKHRALDGVGFDIIEGKTFALVGESGSGKTTTARIVARLETATRGSVVFDGIDVGALRGSGIRQFKRDVQMVYQNPFASLNPRQTIGAIVEEPLLAFSIGDRATRGAAAREMIDAVGLSSTLRERLPRELSGGQRQRVAIARALILQPRLVVLDEPVSALDVSVQSQVLQLLLDLQRDRGLTYLFVSHDLAVVRQVSDRVAVMRHGTIVEQGKTEEIFASPSDAYTRELIEAIPGRSVRAQRD